MKLEEKFRAAFDALETDQDHSAMQQSLREHYAQKTAGQLRWNMSEEPTNSEWVGAQHPSHVALRVVHRALDSYRLHGRLELQGAEVVRYDGAGAHGTAEGRVTVQGRIVLPNAHAVHFDTPVEIRQGRAQEPVVLRIDGVPHIIAQQTFDDFNNSATFYKKRDMRHDMFSPPPDDRQRDMGAEPIVHPGMYKLMAAAEISSRELSCSYGEGRVQSELPKREAVFQAIDVGLQTREDEPDMSNLDPAERALSPIRMGCIVKALDDIPVKGTGIVLSMIAKGTEGQVLRDFDGTGNSFLVEFPFRTVHVLASDIQKVR